MINPYGMPIDFEQETAEQKLMRELEERRQMQEKYAGNILPRVPGPSMPKPANVRPPMAPPGQGSAPSPTAPQQPAWVQKKPDPKPQSRGLLDMIGLGDVPKGDIFTAIGAGMLGLSGNQGLQQMGMAGFEQLGKDKETRKARAQLNKTVQELRDAGRNDLANAVESGMMKASDAANILFDKGGDMKVVGKSAIRFNPETGKVEVLYTDPSGGDEATAAFRTLKARAEEAGLRPGTPEYAQFMIDGGTKSGFAMRMNSDGSVEFVQGSGTLKPLNEFQSKATGFYGRMTMLSPIIDQYEQQGTQLFDNIVKGIPLAGNYLTSPEYKQYMYAKDNWIAAQLRDESGAAIGSDEYANADKQYFPQVGDTAEVIEQKRKLRKQAEEAMKTKAGPGVAQEEKPGAPKTIKIGDVVNGYRYKGGDPNQESSWEKI